LATKSKNKNVPENKTKSKNSEPKVISSVECDKCQQKCRAYFEYVDLLNRGKIGFGLLCKKVKN
jgi:hypothetical protein